MYLVKTTWELGQQSRVCGQNNKVQMFQKKQSLFICLNIDADVETSLIFPSECRSQQNPVTLSSFKTHFFISSLGEDEYEQNKSN